MINASMYCWIRNFNLQPEVLSLQESFTITLGAQMKAMHNLR